MRKEKFSIRKFTVGTASVLVGAALLAGGVNVDATKVSADEPTNLETVTATLHDTEAQAIKAGYDYLSTQGEGGHTGFEVVEYNGKYSVSPNFSGQAPLLPLEPSKPTPEKPVEESDGLKEAGYSSEKEAILDGYKYLENKEVNTAGHTGFTVDKQVNIEGKEVFFVVPDFSGQAPALPLEPSEPTEPEVDVELEKAKEEALKELALAGVTSDAFTKLVKNAKTIEGVNAVKTELLKTAHYDLEGLTSKGFATKEEAEQYAQYFLNNKERNVKGHVDAKINEFGGLFYVELLFVKNEETEAPVEDEDDVEDVDHAAELAAKGFDTEEAAKKAAEDYLNDPTKNVKGHKGYTIKEFGGKFYIELSFNENEEPEAPGKDEGDAEDVDYAAKLAETPFDTEEAAKEAAEDYLNDPTKNVKGHKGYEVKEFGGKYYVVLSFDENEAPEAPVEDEEDVEDVDYAEKLAGTAFDTEKEAIIAGYAYLQDKDKNKAGHTGFEVKEFGGKYYVILNFDGVAPALPVEPGETDKDVDYAEKLAGTAFDTEKDAILAGYDYLLNPDKNKAGHTGFSVQEFGGKYYVILNFDGVAPAVPLEPGKPGEDDKEDGKDPETKPGEGDKKPGEGDGEDDKKPGKEEGDKVAPGKDGKDGKDKKDGKKDGKKLPNTGEAQSGLLASAAALLGAAGLFLVGRRKKAEK